MKWLSILIMSFIVSLSVLLLLPKMVVAIGCALQCEGAGWPCDANSASNACGGTSCPSSSSINNIECGTGGTCDLPADWSCTTSGGAHAVPEFGDVAYFIVLLASIGVPLLIYVKNK